jgi:hypothetical protein
MVMTVLITYIKREKARNLEYNAHWHHLSQRF